MFMNIDRLIQESINDYIDNSIIDGVIDENILIEISKAEKKEKKNIKRLQKDAFDALYRNKKSSKDRLKNLPKDLDSYNKKDDDKEHHPKKNKKEKNVAKNAKKLRNGLRTDFNVKQDRLTNPNLNAQDNEDLSNILDNPAIDLAAIAKKIYPDHTAQGAQSQLRKKVKGLRSDSGSKYKIKKKEAYKLRRILSSLL